jgi:hypothetical protein
MTTGKLDLDGFFQQDARRIMAAREEAIRIHGAGNIDAAGDHLERQVRSILSSRVPSRYCVVQGHIVDYNGRVSPQLDVIVTESLTARSLFQGADGTNFVPYESVYAVGDITSTYYKSREPIQAFAQKLRSIKQNLSRQTTRRNPLLSFLVFVNANGFALDDVEEFYRANPLDELPGFACFLDHAVLLHAKFLRNDYGDLLPVAYHTTPFVDSEPGKDNRWALIQWGSPERRLGANLMFMCVALLQHIQSCVLNPPNLYGYLVLSLDHQGGETFEWSTDKPDT